MAKYQPKKKKKKSQQVFLNLKKIALFGNALERSVKICLPSIETARVNLQEICFSFIIVQHQLCCSRNYWKLTILHRRIKYKKNSQKKKPQSFWNRIIDRMALAITRCARCCVACKVCRHCRYTLSIGTLLDDFNGCNEIWQKWLCVVGWWVSKCICETMVDYDIS